MTDAMDLPWCVVGTAHHKERDVQAELHMAGWATYLPIRVSNAGGGRKRKFVRRPLFERYVFAACEAHGDITAPRGIRGVVAVRRHPDGRSVVRLRIMRALQQAELLGAFDASVEHAVAAACGEIAKGQMVSIVAGALYGWEARIVEVISRSKVRASFTLFREEREAIFDTAHLVPVT